MERSNEQAKPAGFRKQSSPVDYDTDFSNAFSTTWGERARLRVSGADTNNAVCIFEYTAPAGFSPPRHIHHLEDEIFFIREGQVVVWTPEKSYTAGPGDLIFLPKKEAHTWKSYGETPLRAVVTVTPGGFEQFFSILEERAVPITDPEGITAVAGEVGLDVVGPPLTDEEVEQILAGNQI